MHDKSEVNNMKDNQLCTAIRYYMRLHGYDAKKLAKTIGISEASMYNRLREPDSFRYDELFKLSRLFKTTITFTPEGVKMEVEA